MMQEEAQAATASSAPEAGGLEVTEIIAWFGHTVYAALAILAAWGIYNAIMIRRGIKKRTLTPETARSLIEQVTRLLKTGGKSGAEEAVKLCQSPPYWRSALGQLMAVAVANHHRGLAKVKALLVSEFHTEVISVLEMRLASIATIVRMGPLMGLLGTVASMIAAFGRIGGSSKVNPSQLATDISLALWATGAGLLIATPMMIVGNYYHAKLRQLRDRTERQVQDFLDEYEAIEPAARVPRQGRGAVSSR